MAGTHKHGGVLAVPGDDHGAHSSTYPHQTEYVFQNCFIPVLNPASVQDVIDLGPGRVGDVPLRRRLGGDEDHGGDDGAGRHRHRPFRARASSTPDFVLPPHGLNLDHTLHFPAERAELERRMIEERHARGCSPGRAPTGIDRLISGAGGCHHRTDHRRQGA